MPYCMTTILLRVANTPMFMDALPPSTIVSISCRFFLPFAGLAQFIAQLWQTLLICRFLFEYKASMINCLILGPSTTMISTMFVDESKQTCSRCETLMLVLANVSVYSSSCDTRLQTKSPCQLFSSPNNRPDYDTHKLPQEARLLSPHSITISLSAYGLYWKICLGVQINVRLCFLSWVYCTGESSSILISLTAEMTHVELDGMETRLTLPRLEPQHNRDTFEAVNSIYTFQLHQTGIFIDPDSSNDLLEWECEWEPATITICQSSLRMYMNPSPLLTIAKKDAVGDAQ